MDEHTLRAALDEAEALITVLRDRVIVLNREVRLRDERIAALTPPHGDAA